LEKIRPWKQKLVELDNKIIGSTNVVLQISRDGESNMGNFVTDSMVASFNDQWPKEVYPNMPLIGLINSGGIRTSLDKGNISFSDLLGLLPFSNTVDIVMLKGRDLRDTLEFSASSLGTDKRGRFLQVSGIRMTIDMRKPKGNRITDLKVRCAPDCKNAIDINSILYEEIVPNKEYPVVGTKFLFGGNDGYKDLQKSYRDKIEGPLDIEAFQKYLKTQLPVTQDVEGRINIIGNNIQGNNNSNKGNRLKSWSLMFLVIFEIIQYIS